MIKRKFENITDQHAPLASLHAAPVVFQALSTNAHRIKGGRNFQRIKIVMIVRMELKMPLKRLAFAHPMTPTLVTGGFMSSVYIS